MFLYIDNKDMPTDQEYEILWKPYPHYWQSEHGNFWLGNLSNTNELIKKIAIWGWQTPQLPRPEKAPKIPRTYVE